MTDFCQRMSEVALDEIVRDPENGDWAELRAHAATCPVCSAELRDWASIGAGLREMREEVRTGHPREEDLLRFHSRPESLADGQKAEIVAHLASCRACSEELFTVDAFDFSRADEASEPAPRSRMAATKRIAPWKTIFRVALHPAFAYAIALVAGATAIRQTYFQPEPESSRDRRIARRLEAPADTGARARNALQPRQEKLAAVARERDTDLGVDSLVESSDENEDARALAPEPGSEQALLLDEQQRLESDGVGAKADQNILDYIAAEHPNRWNDRYRNIAVKVEEDGETVDDYGVDLYERRDSNSRYWSLLVFKKPSEADGRAMVRDAQRDTSGKFWIYMPATRRVRAVLPTSPNFSDLDLTFQDLDLLDGLPLWPDADASAILRASEVVDGITCHVIEIAVHDAYSPFDSIVVWLGVEDGVLRKAEFFQRGNAGTDAKRLPARRLRQFDVRWLEEIPVPHAIEIQDFGGGITTRMRVIEARVNQGLSESMFDLRSVTRQAIR